MSLGEIEGVLRVLKQFKSGQFMLTDEEGEQFVVVRKEELDRLKKREEQLVLPPAPERENSSAGRVLDRINREIALYQMQQQEQDEEELVDDLALPQLDNNKIKFESLKGDLPPELQD
jgi:hypothetical protein